MASWSSVRPGLLGRAVLTEAERAGEVHAVVARASATLPNAHVLRLSPHTVEPLARLLERLQPDAIVNGTGRTVGASDELMESNVEPVAALIEAMRMAAPGARLVHLGSAAEYAAVLDRATDEEAPLAGIHALCRREGGRVRAPVGRGRGGPGHGRCPRLQPDRCEDASHVPPGAGSAAAAGRGRLGGRHESSSDPSMPCATTSTCATSRRPSTDLASEPHLAHRLVNVGSGRPTVVRDLVHLIAERAGFSGEIDESGSDVSAIAPPVVPGRRHQSHRLHGVGPDRPARRLRRRARRRHRRTGGGRPMSRTRLLLVSMYPLDAGAWGPTTRITHLRDELARLVDLDVVDGDRARRRGRLWRYALSGRLRGLDGIYVENSSTLPSESDLAFLGARAAARTPGPDLRPRRAVPLRRVLRRQRAEAQARPGPVSSGRPPVAGRVEPYRLSLGRARPRGA